MKMEIPVNKSDTFQHIITSEPIKNWEKIKTNYHQVRKHNINQFKPISFPIKSLYDEKKLFELLYIIKEGRKFNQIAIIQCEEKEFQTFWNQLDDCISSLIGFNCIVI